MSVSLQFNELVLTPIEVITLCLLVNVSIAFGYFLHNMFLNIFISHVVLVTYRLKQAPIN